MKIELKYAQDLHQHTRARCYCHYFLTHIQTQNASAVSLERLYFSCSHRPGVQILLTPDLSYNRNCTLCVFSIFYLFLPAHQPNDLPQISFSLCVPCIGLSPHSATYLNNTHFSWLQLKTSWSLSLLPHSTVTLSFWVSSTYICSPEQAVTQHRTSFSTCFSHLHHFSQLDSEPFEASATSSTYWAAPMVTDGGRDTEGI